MLIEDSRHHIIPIVVKTRSYAFFFYFSKKMGRSGDGKRNILFGWPLMLPKKRKKMLKFSSKVKKVLVLQKVLKKCPGNQDMLS